MLVPHTGFSQSWLDFSRTQRAYPGASLTVPCVSSLCSIPCCTACFYLTGNVIQLCSFTAQWWLVSRTELAISLLGTQRKGSGGCCRCRVQISPLQMKTHRPRETQNWLRCTVSETLGPLAPSWVVCPLIHGAQDLSRPSRAMSLVGEVE